MSFLAVVFFCIISTKYTWTVKLLFVCLPHFQSADILQKRLLVHYCSIYFLVVALPSFLKIDWLVSPLLKLRFIQGLLACTVKQSCNVFYFTGQMQAITLLSCLFSGPAVFVSWASWTVFRKFGVFPSSNFFLFHLRICHFFFCNNAVIFSARHHALARSCKHESNNDNYFLIYFSHIFLFLKANQFGLFKPFFWYLITSSAISNSI